MGALFSSDEKIRQRKTDWVPSHAAGRSSYENGGIYSSDRTLGISSQGPFDDIYFNRDYDYGYNSSFRSSAPTTSLPKYKPAVISSDTIYASDLTTDSGRSTGSTYRPAVSSTNYVARSARINLQNQQLNYRASIRTELKFSKIVLKGQNWNEDDLIRLDEDMGLYYKIEDLFYKSLNDSQITINSIYAIQNPYLMGRYLLRKQEKNILFGTVQERLLFHGTKSSYVKNIIEHNFDWRLNGKNIGHRFGQGVSFSPISDYALYYCDEGLQKVMLVAKVMISRICVGRKDMVLPDHGFDTSKKFDGKVIVKYYDDEYYPAYKICFTVSPQINKKYKWGIKRILKNKARNEARNTE